MRTKNERIDKKWWLLGGLAAALATFQVWSLFANRDTGGRIAVSGKVTHNGAPVNSGRIQFTPDRNTAAPAVSAQITNGAYHISAADGLLPGQYAAHVTMTPRATMDPEARLNEMRKPGKGREPLSSGETVIRWPKTLEIAEGNQEVELNFELSATSVTSR